jgi:MerR family transcriptional regulator, thiopeptide resistance regulator
MEKQAATHTVHQLATMAGISVRTLHHYDHIGLLKPSARTAAGYRLYGTEDLLRLQQILLYRELGLPLEEIRRILDNPGFDPVEALTQHKRTLELHAERLARLLHTIDRTIARLMEVDMSLTDEELYEGLPKEQVERWKREVNERYDPKLVAESNRRVHAMSKEQWNAVKAEGDAISRRMAELMGLPAGDPEVQATIARQHAWIENFYPCSAEMFQGLGQHYADHPEFRANYDKYGPGLADFMRDAMAYYAEHTLAVA